MFKARQDVAAIFLVGFTNGFGWLLDHPERTAGRIYSAPVEALSFLPFYPMRLVGAFLIVFELWALVAIRMRRPAMLRKGIAVLFAFWLCWLIISVHALFFSNASWLSLTWAALVVYVHHRLFAAIPVLVPVRDDDGV